MYRSGTIGQYNWLEQIMSRFWDNAFEICLYNMKAMAVSYYGILHNEPF